MEPPSKENPLGLQKVLASQCIEGIPGPRSPRKGLTAGALIATAEVTRSTLREQLIDDMVKAMGQLGYNATPREAAAACLDVVVGRLSDAVQPSKP